MPATGRSAVKQPATRQPAPKKSAPKKSASKKSALKKSAPKPPAARQPAPKKSAPKQKISRPAYGQQNTFDPLDYMTQDELSTIDDQFATALNSEEIVVFWTGIGREHAQRWADQRDLKTLTTAMGPLMDPTDLRSPKSRKSDKAYSRYIKGASGRYAQFACQHCRVIVVTNPPPNIYSTREGNTYQSLEEPILKGLFGTPAVRRIDYIHPVVEGAAHVIYQIWPLNKTEDWSNLFGKNRISKWNKIVWDNKSFISTSHSDLRLSQTRAVFGTINQAGDVAGRFNKPNNVFESKISSGTENVPVVSTYDNTPPIIQAVRNNVAELQATSKLPGSFAGTEPHRSRAFDKSWRLEEPIASDSQPSSTKIDHHIDQKIDFHEMEVFLESEHSARPLYTIERCPTPQSLVELPIVHIDRLVVGSEMTIEVGIDKAREAFVLLAMKTISGSELWWRLHWT